MSPFFNSSVIQPTKTYWAPVTCRALGSPGDSDPALPSEALFLRVSVVQVQIVREPASESCGPDELVQTKSLMPVRSGPSRWELLLHRHCPQGAENPGEITVVIKYRNKKNKILKQSDCVGGKEGSWVPAGGGRGGGDGFFVTCV